jgi:hypothetical protein
MRCVVPPCHHVCLCFVPVSIKASPCAHRLTASGSVRQNPGSLEQYSNGRFFIPFHCGAAISSVKNEITGIAAGTGLLLRLWSASGTFTMSPSREFRLRAERWMLTASWAPTTLAAAHRQSKARGGTARNARLCGISGAQGPVIGAIAHRRCRLIWKILHRGICYDLRVIPRPSRGGMWQGWSWHRAACSCSGC